MASNKLRKASAADQDEAKVDMSPMIDMVFLLLIFFIVNATAIIVQTDPKVLPPVAKNSKMQKERGGRIVINVWEDGTYTNEALENLADEAAMIALVEEQRKEIESKGLEAKLHLRGDQNAVFKYSRTAIRAAADAGVTEVVFAVYQTHKGLPAAPK
jgi:biopolymer transport protein ExbD